MGFFANNEFLCFWHSCQLLLKVDFFEMGFVCGCEEVVWKIVVDEVLAEFLFAGGFHTSCFVGRIVLDELNVTGETGGEVTVGVRALNRVVFACKWRHAYLAFLG